MSRADSVRRRDVRMAVGVLVLAAVAVLAPHVRVGSGQPAPRETSTAAPTPSEEDANPSAPASTPPSGDQVDIGARSTDPKVLAEAIRQTNITEKMTLGGPIKFNEKGQVEGIGSACVQNLNLTPTVVLPANAATAKPVFPVPGYKKA